MRRLAAMDPVFRMATIIALIIGALGAQAMWRGAADEQTLVGAAARGDLAAVRDALERGVPADAKNGEPIILAVDIPSPQIVRLLLAHGADPSNVCPDGYTPLQWACWRGDPQILQLLLDAGADPNQTTDLPETALCIATSQGRDRAVEILLAHGASAKGIYAQGATHFEPPLVCAARGGFASAHLVEQLIHAGADVNQPDDEGKTPLKAALGIGRLDLARVLIANGAQLCPTRMRSSLRSPNSH